MSYKHFRLLKPLLPNNAEHLTTIHTTLNQAVEYRLPGAVNLPIANCLLAAPFAIFFLYHGL